MPRAIDLTGQKFGKLLVLSFNNSDKGYRTWKCQCDCGNICIVPTKTLRNGTAKSCGCVRKELLKKRRIKHSLTNTRLYIVWKDIKQRCNNPQNPTYKFYGAKGIKLCQEWETDFQNFYNWAIKNGYNETAARGAYTIDRIDYNKNYTPENCRWITIQQQQENKRSNFLITYNGVTLSLLEWAKVLNIKYKTLQMRFQRKWSVEKAFTSPLRKW